MDQLFLMQRYWGSDEEDDGEENGRSFEVQLTKSKSFQEKPNIPVIDLDGIVNSTHSRKKQKLEPDVIEICNESDSEKDCSIISPKEDNIVSDSEKDCSIISPKEDNIVCDNENSIEISCDINNSGSNESSKVKSQLNGSLNSCKKNNSKAITKQKIKSRKVKEDEKKSALEKKFDKSDNVETLNNQGFSAIGRIYKQKKENLKHTLPNWLSNPTYISVNLQEQEIPISELNYLDSTTKKNLENANISYLFPVQLAVIPWLMQSEKQSRLLRPSDICVSAPTGSGKTLAFVLPIVQSLKDRVVRAIRALVVLPVSELAIQVFKVFETFVVGTDLKVALLTGKKSFIAEQNALVKTNGQSILSLVDIVVTTPGRIHDHMSRTKGFCLKRLRYIVIDEADRMMVEIQQGWLKQVEEAVFNGCLYSNCICSSYKRISFEPTSAFKFGFISQPLQKLLYSATLTHDPEQLHNLFLYKPKLFTALPSDPKQDFKGSCAIPSGLKLLQVVCTEGIKPMIITHLIRQHDFKKVLCFTETVERAHRLHLVLEGMGLFQVREISSFNRAIQRKIVLEQFSSGKINILVCSDLVARGIDINDIDCVISYDVPQHEKTFVHRIGRTARAGKAGAAITLLSEGEVHRFKKMLKSVGIDLPEKVDVDADDLKPFVDSYKTSLSVADAKLKQERNHLPC